MPDRFRREVSERLRNEQRRLLLSVKDTPGQDRSKGFVLDPYWLIELLEEHADRADMIRRWKEFSEK